MNRYICITIQFFYSLCRFLKLESFTVTNQR